MVYLRIELMIKNKFYYDIGLRKEDRILSKTQVQMGHKCPRYLEDFIKRYGKSEIVIIDYGCLIGEKKYIDNLLK